MSEHASQSYPMRGKALPPGVVERLHEAPVEPEPPQRTETLPPPANALNALPADLPEPEAPTRPDVLLGQRLGEYVVRRYMGSGGMGVVYEGEHTTIGRKVAIKFIREEQTRSPHARGLLSEARAASSIRHHGIIDIYGFGQQPGVGQYLVMEYLEGRPLDVVIQQRAPLALAEAVPLLCEVLEALSAAHAAGVIHRDLKPSNIFLVRQTNGAEYVKVLDFGLAKRTDAPNGTTPQTHSNLIVGTPQYMAPEQALGAAVGPRSDLYAVGVIVFELLTGQRPFQGRTQMEVMLQHLQAPPPPPSTLVPLPPEVDTLVLRLLAKAPEQRPASASDVARALRELLQRGERGDSEASARGSRSVPGVRPLADVALAQASTATVSPPQAVGPLGGEVASRSFLGTWRKWGTTVAGGCLAVAIGVGWVVSRERVGPVLPTSATARNEAAPAHDRAAPAPEAVPSPPEGALSLSKGVPGSSDAVPADAASEFQVSARQVRAPAPVLRSPSERASALRPSARAAKPTPAQAKKKSFTSTAPAAPPVSPAQPTDTAAEHSVERPATGLLQLTVKGAWTDVWVDGQKIGRVPPLNRYLLTAGEHELELRNPAFAPYRRNIVIPPDGKLTHTADFTTEGQASSATVP